MREWFEAQLAEGLPAFAGTSVSGTVAMKQELLTELLTNWLADAAPGAPNEALDLQRAKSFVKSLTVRAEAGRLLVDFSIAV